MGSLVAVRQRRERVIAQLTECYERDLLDVDELDRMLDQAHAASTLAELDALVAGLAPQTALTPVESHAVHDPTRLAKKRLGVMFSHIERTGHWAVPRRLEIQGLFGNVLLDFREASLASGVSTIEVKMSFGYLELLLPPWLPIDVDVSSLGGTVEEKHRVARRPDLEQPLLHVTGAVNFGNLEICTRLPGETRSEARKREKHERRERREAHLASPPRRGQM